jgi:hypothetical protein
VSLAIAIKGPEGIVLAADSRVTLEAHRGSAPPLPVHFDNATKLISLSGDHKYVGIVTYGLAVIGQRTAHSFLPEIEQTVLPEKGRLTVQEYSEKLSAFFLKQWQQGMPAGYNGPDMSFVVGGYSSGQPYGEVFLFSIPRTPNPVEQHVKGFGMTWGGQLEVVSRVIQGFDPGLPSIAQKVLSLSDLQKDTLYTELKKSLEYPIPFQVLALQDCVDLATFLIRSTMTAQRMAIALRGVGGAIDVATITRAAGLDYVQRKQVRGEGP